jgi:molybdopterin-binding protein
VGAAAASRAGIERVRLHADLTILAKLSCARARLGRHVLRRSLATILLPSTGTERRGMPLSARNQIKGTVTKITQGEAIANVEIDASGQRLVASITVEAAKELGLSEGSEVTAIIKASDVILAT